MADTLRSLRTEILNWLRGDYAADTDLPLLNSSINDAIEDIWTSMMQIQLARFFGLDSPVTFTLPQGAERVQLVSIPDPLAAPTLGQLAGATLPARTYLVCYTYVTESGSETLPSPTASLAIGLNNLAQVTSPPALSNAIGWNCYASITNNPALLGLQNPGPLPFSIVPFTESPIGWIDYPGAQQQPGVAQSASQATPASSPPPSENTTADNIAWIVQMEVRTSDTLLRSWNQYDIGSEMFRRYGRELSSASEYQTYVWDLVNGNRLEFRPAAGLAFNPRYFYVAKPRRLRYDQATIPYLNVAGVREYLVCKAVARLKLGLDEYLADQAWSGKADKTKAQIVAALTQELWAKDLRITPHLFAILLGVGLTLLGA
jgi:hypothetical protein